LGYEQLTGWRRKELQDPVAQVTQPQRRLEAVAKVILAPASLLHLRKDRVGTKSPAEYRRCLVLYWAFVFLIVGLVAAMLGFTNIAGGAFAIAKFLAGLFLVLFLIFLVLGLSAARKIVG
jgi:uncharacterized membrane protein YtjA (UPF0391 family)